MANKKDIVRRAAMPRIREQSTLMHTHESFVDLINGRYPRQPFLDVLGFNFFGNYGANLRDDFVYSDDDTDDDDDIYPSRDAYSSLEPHPRIRQLTEEEADQHAKELIAEEERLKGKTERNKRKKMRKKERKRLEKENAVKENLSEKQSSENQEENPIIVNNVDANESSKTQSVTEAAGGDEGCAISKEETVVRHNKQDVEAKETDLNNSYDSTPKSVPEETFNQKPVKEQKKKNSQLVEIQQRKEEKPKTMENLNVEKKDEKQETKTEEKASDPSTEECAKRSRDLAATGNRLAASGQYEIAVKCFTDAIKFNPKEYKLFGNRSLCYERMQQYENALRDADLALCMEPGWIKGLFRKGKALCGLKKYYEASLIYAEVLKLDSSSAEAKQELKRAQTLHLMEMGFTREQSLEALKTHATLEHAVEALFCNSNAAVSKALMEQTVEQEDCDSEGDWVVQQTSRLRTQQVKESNALSQSRSKSQSPTPPSRSSVKPELLSIWVGSLAPTVTYATLHELFSRVGVVYSIKMLLEHQCAFVNYTRKEDCDRAIQSFNGMVVEGAPLSVRYPSKNHMGLGLCKKECFFWRTTGCTRQDCTYKHVPEHKNIDRDKFTSRLGRFNV